MPTNSPNGKYMFFSKSTTKDNSTKTDPKNLLLDRPDCSCTLRLPVDGIILQAASKVPFSFFHPVYFNTNLTSKCPSFGKLLDMLGLPLNIKRGLWK